MPRLVDVLAAELALLEAEAATLDYELAQGFAVDGHRRPFTHELRARVRFADLERETEQAAQLIARRAGDVRQAVLDDLHALEASGSPADVVARLQALADPSSRATLPNVSRAVDHAAARIEADLHAAAQQGAAGLLGEARDQGLGPARLPASVPLDTTSTDLLGNLARQAAQQPVARILAAALDGATRAAPAARSAGDILTAAHASATSASTAGTLDTARQAASSALNLGRTAAARLAPEPAAVYASELLDSRTCAPCGRVDGRRYDTLAHALEDYPGAGGFIFCEGGFRCRGTLVYVWPTEAAPTIDDTDNPPQGPSDPPPERPPPLPPDDRTSFPRPEPPAPPLTPAPVPARDVPPAPDLAAMTDAELDAHLNAAVDNPDEVLRICDELDRRAVRDPAVVDNPDVDEADLWRSHATDDVDTYAEEELATDEAFAVESHIDVTLEAPGPGRRIDKLRSTFSADAHRRYLEADEATRGNLIRRDRMEEFRAKGYDSFTDLFTGPARVAYHYASEELRAFWLESPRLTFDEFAVQAGIRDAKTMARARAAKTARETAETLAEERPDIRAKRRAESSKRAAARRRQGPGAELEREQRRIERARKAAERDARRAAKPDPPAEAEPTGVAALPRKAADTDPVADAEAVNPGYGDTPAYGVNCVHVVNANELRRRGYDVTASPLPKPGTPTLTGVDTIGVEGRSAPEAVNRWTCPDGTRAYMTPYTRLQLLKEVGTWPVGARGWVRILWQRNYGGGGHIFNVEVTADGVKWIDAQKGIVLDNNAWNYLARARQTKGGRFGGAGIEAVRVDELTPDDTVLEFINPPPGAPPPPSPPAQ